MSERDDIFDELIGADTDDADEFADAPETDEDDEAETLALRKGLTREHPVLDGVLIAIGGT